MISASQHGQGRRTYEEDDEDIDLVQSSTTELLLDLDLESDATSGNTNAIIFSTSIHSFPFVESIMKTLDIVEIGRVKVVGSREILSTVQYSKSSGTLLILGKGTVPNELVVTYASLFDRFGTNLTVVFGEYNILSHTGLVEEGELRQVTSRQFTERIVPQLESQNLVTGVAAALLCRAESRNKRCVVFLTLSRAYLTVPSMRAFVALSPYLHEVLGTTIPPPPQTAYTALVKRDPYVHRTENMYS